MGEVLGQREDSMGEVLGQREDGRGKLFQEKIEKVGTSTRGIGCISKPTFKFAGVIKRKGRVPGQAKKVKKAAQRIFKVASLTGNPFKNVKGGEVTISEDEDEVNAHNKGMSADDVSLDNTSVCGKCGNEQVDKAICSAPAFCEIVICDMCSHWFHAVCVTGNLKLKRGAKFRCHICSE